MQIRCLESIELNAEWYLWLFEFAHINSNESYSDKVNAKLVSVQSMSFFKKKILWLKWKEMENTGCWAWRDTKKNVKSLSNHLDVSFYRHCHDFTTKLPWIRNKINCCICQSKQSQCTRKSQVKWLKGINVLHLYNCETQRYLLWMQYERYDFAYCLWCAQVYMYMYTVHHSVVEPQCFVVFYLRSINGYQNVNLLGCFTFTRRSIVLESGMHWNHVMNVVHIANNVVNYVFMDQIAFSV